MGEWSEFDPGHRAPNDGVYIEVGEQSFHMGVNDPKKISLKKGERFPDTSNHNRKWKRLK
ncbi:YjzC family protein [uncultured Paenibacillus sp.]|uniref:YjzC family protein n=1 Tax=uncultured Paenibacillus sp. TaxID=227322 RepID=UPI0028D7FD1A|nr:YjzC family protein [uncultured Paenibacillus sp.]